MQLHKRYRNIDVSREEYLGECTTQAIYGWQSWLLFFIDPNFDVTNRLSFHWALVSTNLSR